MSIEVFNNTVFYLNTKNTSYVLLIENGLLTCAHWGGHITSTEDFAMPGGPPEWYNKPEPMREECSSFGTMHFKETSLKLRFEDGTRDFRYKIENFTIEEDTLCIQLQDEYYPCRVLQYYKVYHNEDVIEKWRQIYWDGEGNAILERIYSGEFSLPGRGYESLNYQGHWGTEFRAFSEPVDSGKKVYESLHSIAGHGCSPFFVVHRNAHENTGEVYFGAVGYSGNFKIVVEAVSKNYLSILAGVSDTDFEVCLKKGQVFVSPPVYSGCTKKGFTGMTHILTKFAKKNIMPKYWRDKPLPILYNSWYATTFDVHCNEQMALAERAARLGVELFVVDDGWFKGRNNDKAGLGDWTPDEEKFPDGLAPLIERVNELGMTFGIWIEPEMVNPDSDLYRAHPDWVLCYKNRQTITWRNQYMLDMTNPEVMTYLYTCFDALLKDNNIAYVKWDMNRFASEMGSDIQEPVHYKEMWHQNTEGFYKLIAFLRTKHPTVEFEACASGGGRVDYGAMKWFDEYWPSDNTDPLDRLEMQHNYSYVYPIKYMRAWLTDDFGMDHRKVPVRFAMHSAMCGALGIGVNLNEKSDEEIAEIKAYVDDYKKVRDTVQFGDLYRLKKMAQDGFQAVEYVKEHQVVLFAFLDHEMYGASIFSLCLQGLNAEAMYEYEAEIQGKNTLVVKSGSYLMEHGLTLRLQGDYASQMITFCKKE